MSYTAGWNMPGCLPDSAEPSIEFDSFEEALNYLYGEVVQAADMIPYDQDNEDGTPAYERMVSFAEDVRHWRFPQSSAAPDNLVYWIEEEDPYAGEPPHVGHYSQLGGTYWCDTCNSPYCERA